MANIAIQLESQHTTSSTLDGTMIAFIPEPGLEGIEGAVINETQWEQIEDALQAIPYKIDKTGTGTAYEAINGANW